MSDKIYEPLRVEYVRVEVQLRDNDLYKLRLTADVGAQRCYSEKLFVRDDMVEPIFDQMFQWAKQEMKTAIFKRREEDALALAERAKEFNKEPTPDN